MTPVAEGSIRLGILKALTVVPISASASMSCRGLDPIGDTERHALPTCRVVALSVAEGSIRLGILKDACSARLGCSLHPVAEGSIRLGILKVVTGGHRMIGLSVAEGSIRLGILKGWPPYRRYVGFASCRGLDPIGDTERLQDAANSCYRRGLQRARSD